MVDAYNRVAYTEALPNERGATCADFLVRARAFFAELGVQIEEVMTDEAKNYTVSRDFAEALEELLATHQDDRPLPAPHQRQGRAL